MTDIFAQDADPFTVHIGYDYPTRMLSVANDQSPVAGTEGDKASTKVAVTMTGTLPAGRTYTMMFDVRVLDEHKVRTKYVELEYDSVSGDYIGWIPPDVFNNTLRHKLPIQMKIEWEDADEVKHRFYSLNMLTFVVLRKV